MIASMPLAAEKTQDRDFFLDQAYRIALPYGDVVPLYQVEPMGRREQTPVRLYKDGSLRSLPLQERTFVHTLAGVFPAEHLTFYPGGELRRLFPSAGKLTGFWSEEMEYAQAPFCEFKVGFHRFKARPISIQFYPGGGHTKCHPVARGAGGPAHLPGDHRSAHRLVLLSRWKPAKPGAGVSCRGADSHRSDACL